MDSDSGIIYNSGRRRRRRRRVYTMSVLIELVNWALRKLRWHVYIYMHTARIYTDALEPYYVHTLSVLGYRI